VGLETIHPGWARPETTAFENADRKASCVRGSFADWQRLVCGAVGQRTASDRFVIDLETDGQLAPGDAIGCSPFAFGQVVREGVSRPVSAMSRFRSLFAAGTEANFRCDDALDPLAVRVKATQPVCCATLKPPL
jgi:hypothetical protein